MLVTAEMVADKVAVLMNDTQKAVYKFDTVLPYLNIACTDLQETFEQNNIPVTNAAPFIFHIDANTDPNIQVIELKALPVDLVEIERLWESPRGQNNWIPMTRKDTIPYYMEGAPTNMFVWWTWEEQKIKLLPSTSDNDIKMDYIRSLFPELTNKGDSINVINARSYLQYHTAALCSMFIGENEARAKALEDKAVEAMDKSLGISTKGQQQIVTRRRPFMARFKSRGVW